jgi:type IV secretion system protein VirD4
MKKAVQSSGQPWRFNDLKNSERPMTVYLVTPPTKAELLAPFNRLLVTGICSETLSTPRGNHHITILADEFPLLGRMPELEPIFTMGGNAGISLILIAQSVSKMTQIWGQQGWDAMQLGLDVTLYFPTHDPQTVKELVQRGGQETVVTQSYSYSPPAPLGKGGLSLFGNKSTSHGETGKPVLDGHALASLSGRCFISAPRMPELKGNLIEGHMRAYWDYEDNEDNVAELCDPNPWHKSKTSTGAAQKTRAGV